MPEEARPAGRSKPVRDGVLTVLCERSDVCCLKAWEVRARDISSCRDTDSTKVRGLSEATDLFPGYTSEEAAFAAARHPDGRPVSRRRSLR